MNIHVHIYTGCTNLPTVPNGAPPSTMVRRRSYPGQNSCSTALSTLEVPSHLTLW